jgi:ribonuclease HI
MFNSKDARMMKQQRLELYSDGSCLKNPGGPGAYAAILLLGGTEIDRFSGYEFETTSNRMEMMGVIVGLEALPAGCSVTVHSDSQLVINCAARRWKRKKNLDLWQRLDTAARSRSVKWQWVRGHAGNRWNEAADALCGAAAREGQEQDEATAIAEEERAWERAAWDRFQ